MLTLPTKPLTRRQFFGRLRTLGFKKSRLQMTRIGLTYERDEGDGKVMVTVPKYHSSTFTILGDILYSGIFVEAIPGRPVNWGTPVDTDALGMNMLEVCLGLCSGDIQMVQQPIDGRQEGGPA